jgi:hypothetical protein
MQSTTAARPYDPFAGLPWSGLHRLLNVRWHRNSLLIFAIITWVHVAEHVFQAVQIFVLGWPRPQALGALGMLSPWLIKSEWLHYAYAIIMLLGLFLLRPAFSGQARRWWDLALAIQFWHHIEHGLLLYQALTGHLLFGTAVPSSVLQLVIPRAELHIFYNLVVLVPMMIGMYLHRYGRPDQVHAPICDCRKAADDAAVV